MSPAEMERAWEARDPGYDELFVLGVKTTGIFCKPSCPSRPKREHLEFFQTPGEALHAGYRPCKRCRPLPGNDAEPDWVQTLKALVKDSTRGRIDAASLQAAGVTPERARRWFVQQHGMTFSHWARNQRLARAFDSMRTGATLDDVVFENGFESHSGFRTAFARIFGRPPGDARDADCVRVKLMETALGPMIGAVTNQFVCHLAFADRGELPALREHLARRFKLPVVLGDSTLLDALDRELAGYFSGTRTAFSLPLATVGTTFQRQVWDALRNIPYGVTRSYKQIATELGRPSAVRAVARANASNGIYLLIPCHRVIGSDAALSGYGGGVWRKRLLLELEAKAMREEWGTKTTQASPDPAR